MKRHSRQGKVFFIGAGPGDPDLLTMAGARIIKQADCIVYAGSLVNPAVLEHAGENARLIDSAPRDLTDITGILVSEARRGHNVVRLHSGDPSLYGAIAEQIEILRRHRIPWEIVPGVSSVSAAAAALGIEYTLPEQTQTLILTRRAGRTPVPERESLTALAAHRSSMAVFLSADMIAEVAGELAAGGYPPATPAAVVYRASWPDQKIVTGTLATIAGRCRAAGITRQALIIVGDAVGRRRRAKSRLYAPDFTHGYRTGDDRRQRIAIIAVTRRGVLTGRKILHALDGAVLHIPEKYTTAAILPGVVCYRDLRRLIHETFPHCRALVLVMATGIAVRMIAPLLRSKWDDPAVVCTDDSGRNIISLLSGHWGGANDIASRLALALGGNPVITTESDVMGFPSIDLLVKALSVAARPADTESIKNIQAMIIDGKDVGFYPKALQHFPGMAGNPSLHFYDSVDDALASACAAVVIASPFQAPVRGRRGRCLHIVPRSIVAGIGCHAGITAREIETGLRRACKKLRLHHDSLAAVCTIDRRKAEPGLIAFCKARGIPLRTFSARRLKGIRGPSPASPHVMRAIGVSGVAEPCAMLGSGGGRLILHKEKTGNMTIAIAQKSLQQLLDEGGVDHD